MKPPGKKIGTLEVTLDRKKTRRQETRSPKTGGAVVSGTDPCTCGCAPEAHGRDPEYPGSTSCTECGGCIAYEADPEVA